MYARKRLDVDWADVFASMGYVLNSRDAAHYERALESRFGAAGHEELAGMLLPGMRFYGCDAEEHIYWLFALVVPNPAEVIAALREGGFDATNGSSTLAVIASEGLDDHSLAEARQDMDHIV